MGKKKNEYPSLFNAEIDREKSRPTISNPLSLHPDHLEDLRKSGLLNETITQAGIYSVRPSDIPKKLEGKFMKVESLLAFPYPGADGFERFKLFPAQQTEKGTIRYYQKAGTAPRLYIPAKAQAVLQDVSIPLYLTEGEKKALKACQEGLFCISAGGLWNWSDGSEEKNLIPDFDKIEWKGRTVYLIPDNDWLDPDRHGEPKNLKQAVNELAYRLIDRGAKVSIIELPKESGKGLDDYLCHHPVEEFKALPKREVRKQTIQEMVEEASIDNLKDILKRLVTLPETERALHINGLSKKLNITKRAIQKDIESLSRRMNEDPDIERLLESGANPHSQYSAQNFDNGVLSYGVILGKQRVLLQSDGEIIFPNGSKGDSFRFKRSVLTPEVIKRFRAGDDVNGKDLINQIERLFSDHIIFKDDRIPQLLSVWVMGTYFFKVFRFYGYLWVNSPVKRCGKSLLLDILSLISFNATPRLVNPSEASVFREVDSNDATLIIDEVESLSHGEKDQRSELISLLNSGFQRGSLASRVETRNKEFVVTYFNSYCPKALAGIKSIVDTIEDRSFKVPMARKAKSETIKRFNLKTLDSQIEKIREDCFLWALRYVGDVSEFYVEMPELQGTKNLDDRMKDILEPLLSIASIIDAQAEDKTIRTVKNIVELASDMGRGREDAEALNGSIPAVVNVMKQIIDGIDERFISADELFSKFQGDEDLGFIQSKRGMAFFLSKLELYRTLPRWIEEKTTRGYLVTKRWVDDLEKRYT